MEVNASSGVFVGVSDGDDIIVTLDVKVTCGVGVIPVEEAGRQPASTMNNRRNASPFQTNRDIFILVTLILNVVCHQASKYIPMRNQQNEGAFFLYNPSKEAAHWGIKQLLA